MKCFENRVLLAFITSCLVFLCMTSVQILSKPTRDPEDAMELAQKAKDIAAKEGLIQSLTNKLACLTKGVLPSGGFCLENAKAFQGGNHVWDGKLCAALEDIIGSASVGDFGAGLGHYGSCFLRLGGSMITTSNNEQTAELSKSYATQMRASNLIDKPQVIKSWEGFDSAFNIDNISGGKIHTVDLSKELHLDHKFDWVISLEVGEHIPKEYESVFINNLVRHACTGIVLSWAVKGQGGYNHVNNQNNDYIQRKMEEQGLVLDAGASSTIRTLVDVGWFKNTLMVYRFTNKRC